MKTIIFLLLACVLVVDTDAWLDNLKDVGFGGGFGHVKWKKEHENGHSAGQMFGGALSFKHGSGFNFNTAGGFNLGDQPQIDMNGLGSFGDIFQHLGGAFAAVGKGGSGQDATSDEKLGIGYGKSEGKVSGKDIILGEGFGIGRGDAGGIGIGHGKGVFIKEGGIEGEGAGLGIGFGLGNGVGYGRGPNVGKITEFLRSIKMK